MALAVLSLQSLRYVLELYHEPSRLYTSWIVMWWRCDWSPLSGDTFAFGSGDIKAVSLERKMLTSTFLELKRNLQLSDLLLCKIPHACQMSLCGNKALSYAILLIARKFQTKICKWLLYLCMFPTFDQNKIQICSHRNKSLWYWRSCLFHMGSSLENIH